MEHFRQEDVATEESNTGNRESIVRCSKHELNKGMTRPRQEVTGIISYLLSAKFKFRSHTLHCMFQFSKFLSKLASQFSFHYLFK